MVWDRIERDRRLHESTTWPANKFTVSDLNEADRCIHVFGVRYWKSFLPFYRVCQHGVSLRLAVGSGAARANEVRLRELNVQMGQGVGILVTTSL